MVGTQIPTVFPKTECLEFGSLYFLFYLEDVVNCEDFSSFEMNVFVNRESCMTNLKSWIVLLKKKIVMASIKRVSFKVKTISYKLLTAECTSFLFMENV